MEPRKAKYDLTEGVIWKSLLLFLGPIALGTLFQQLYNTVDAVVVGRYVGKQALAAVGGSSAVILNLFIGFFVGLSSGAGVVVAHYRGAGDDEGLSRSVHTAMALCLAAGAALTVVGLLSAWPFLRLLNTTADTIADSALYLKIYYLGSIPMMIFNMGSAILRSVGDSKHPLYYLVASCVANIVLDLLFVAGLGWGVSGVAVATVLSQFLSAALVLWRLMRTSEAYALRLKKLRFHGEILKTMLRICIPAALEGAMYSISNLIIQSSVNSFDTDVVAAWSTTGKLDGVYWALSNSFGMAIMAFVGQNFGAGKYERMKKSVRVCMAMAMGMTVVISALLLVFGRYCFRIFTDDAVVIEYCVTIMGYFVPFYFTWTFIEVLSNSLRGAGDAVIPMAISVIGVCGLRVAWILLVFPRWHTLMGLSMCYPFTWIVTGAALSVYYLRGKWLQRSITVSKT